MARKNHRTPRAPRPVHLSVKNPHAAGVDIGSTFHCAAVPPDRDAESVRTFAVYTPDLHELVAWLKGCCITTVAMEATGVYWIPLYEILLEAGLEAVLVNPLFVKRMRDPKTDVADSQLLLQLHTFGQLPASFRPPLDISVLRSYWRQRERLVGEAADAIRLMQKSLTLMNLHPHKAISDISGVTGLRIIRAILGGVHDPKALAGMRERGIKCSQEELEHALTGNYRQEHLFALKLAVQRYDFAHQQIQECDRALGEFTSSLPDGETEETDCDDKSPDGTKQHRPRRNEPQAFDLHGEVERLTGRNFECIPGLGAMTVMTGISEVGLDMTRWESEQHFASWLSLSPNPKVTGGQVISSHTRRNKNRFATALRLAATSLQQSKSALGAQYRSLRARLGPAKAVTAMAHRLACLYYRLMRYGAEYLDIGQEAYEAKYRERTLKYLKKRAAALGMELHEKAATPC